MANVPKSDIGIKITKNSHTIPYLMFANDSMIFYKATRSAARNVQSILKNYYNVSGQVVNYHKSTIQFSKGMDKLQKLDILDILQVPTSKNFETYLGYKNIDYKRITETLLSSRRKLIV